MTVQGAIKQGAEVLSGAGVESAWLDAVLLYALASGKTKEQLLLDFGAPADTTIHTSFEALITRRCAGEHMAYIRGYQEFWSLDFAVGPGVLVPRPETEGLIEWVIESSSAKLPLQVRDVCTGSGCIPIVLQRQCPAWHVTGSDISEAALVWASKNAKALLLAPLSLIQADLLSDCINRPYSIEYDIITANPPYVPELETFQKVDSGWKEPMLALNGGIDGLDLIRKLVVQAWTCLVKGGSFYMETGDGQSVAVLSILESSGFVDCHYRKDLSGIDRICRGTKP